MDVEVVEVGVKEEAEEEAEDEVEVEVEEDRGNIVAAAIAAASRLVVELPKVSTVLQHQID